MNNRAPEQQGRAARAPVIARALQTAWAPAAVLVLGLIVGPTSFARDLWWLLHLLGGTALAFFFLHAIDALGLVKPLGRYVVAFALACTTALGWELLEYAIDRVAGSTLQVDLLDTMSDLMFGVCGAALYLAYAAFTESKA